MKIGDEVGSCDGDGYLQLKVRGCRFRVHQIVWLIHFGVIPEMLDHKDGNRSNNRIENLRVVDALQNAQNKRKSHKNSKSGVLGVHKCGRKWKAEIHVNGVRNILGYFEDIEVARTAYLDAKRKYHIACTI